MPSLNLLFTATDNAQPTIWNLISPAADRAQTGELYETLEKIYYDFCEAVARGEGTFEARDRAT